MVWPSVLSSTKSALSWRSGCTPAAANITPMTWSPELPRMALVRACTAESTEARSHRASEGEI